MAVPVLNGPGLVEVCVPEMRAKIVLKIHTLHRKMKHRCKRLYSVL